MNLVSPRKMIINAVTIVALSAFLLFLSPFTVGTAIEQAIDNPLITAGIVSVTVIVVLFGEGGTGGGPSGDL